MSADAYTQRFLAAVQGVSRLLRVASFHATDNEAVSQAMTLARKAIAAFSEDADGLSMVFTRDTAIVNGRLLQADPEIYAVTMEFGQFLIDAGINSIQIGPKADESDMRALLTFLRTRRSFSDEERVAERLSPHVRLRRIPDHFLLGIEDPTLSEAERILLTYALAVRVVRTQQSVQDATPRVPPYFKRVARQLILADVMSRPALVNVLLDPRSAADAARFAVNRAIVVGGLLWLLEANDQTRVRACVTAMLVEFGANHTARAPHAPPRERATLAAAWTQIAAGQLRDDAVERLLVCTEVLSMLGGTPVDQLYAKGRPPATLSLIIVHAHRLLAQLIHAKPGDPNGMALAWLAVEPTPDQKIFQPIHALLGDLLAPVWGT